MTPTRFFEPRARWHLACTETVSMKHVALIAGVICFAAGCSVDVSRTGTSTNVAGSSSIRDSIAGDGNAAGGAAAGGAAIVGLAGGSAGGAVCTEGLCLFDGDPPVTNGGASAGGGIGGSNGGTAGRGGGVAGSGGAAASALEACTKWVKTTCRILNADCATVPGQTAEQCVSATLNYCDDLSCAHRPDANPANNQLCLDQCAALTCATIDTAWPVACESVCDN